MKILNLSGNHIENNGATCIFQIKEIVNLNINKNNIKALHLINQKIGDAEAAHIAKIQGITELVLSSNQIGNVGAPHISHMKGIKRLDINDNHIGIDGAAYIFQMKGVTNLNLKHDSITRVSSFL